jgi:hypothetical protein
MNFTLRDIIGACLALVLFVPVLLAPGYVLAWFTGVLDFRRITSPWKLLVSLPLSVAVCPITTYWIGFNGSWTPVLALYGICFLLFLSLLAGLWKHDALLPWLGGFRSVPRSGWIVPAIWLIVVIASLTDLNFQNRLYLSITDVDHLTRAAITGAIARDGVRPSNPFYYLGSFAPLRYHYFWFILCGLVKMLSGSFVTSQQAIIASVVWCGWALFALVPLFLRFFAEMTGTVLRRCSLVAICLFAVTGLDLLPNALHIAVFHRIYPDMEWWNEQVASWLGTLLWVPHHVAGLVTCLTGFLVLWNAALTRNPRRYLAAGVIAGAAFAGGTGTSIYVTLVFVFILIAWGAVTILWRWWNHTIVLLIAGVVSLLLVRPYLHSLAGPGAGGSFVNFDVRQFIPIDMLANKLRLAPLPHSLLRLATLPLNYFLELGFFGVVAVLYLWGLPKLRKLSATGKLPTHVVAALTIASVSVIVCTFLRSGVIAANDLGWRGFLPAQFIMLLWAADLMVQRGSRAQAQGKGFHSWWLRSPAWAVLILVGLGGTVYEAILLRTYLVANDFGLVAGNTVYTPDHRFGERAWDIRRAYEYLDRSLPPRAKVQSSSDSKLFDFYHGLYSNRQTVAGDGACGAVFGGEPAACPAALADVSAIFDGLPGNTSETWQDVQNVSRRLSIDALIVTDFDPAWQDDNSWIRHATPAFSAHHVRVYLVDSPRL